MHHRDIHPARNGERVNSSSTKNGGFQQFQTRKRALPDSSVQTYTWDERGNLTHNGTFTYTYPLGRGLVPLDGDKPPGAEAGGGCCGAAFLLSLPVMAATFVHKTVVQ
jgi:hypothetical protein